MLQKIYRIRENRDYLRIYQRGRRLETANLRFFFLRSANSRTRFGFVVSKRSAKKQETAAGRIVDRNRLKRILRDEVRRLLPEIAPGFEVVVQSKNGAVKISSQALRKELKSLFQKAGLLQ